MPYWQSTKSPVHMFKRVYECQEVARHITENAFVDAAAISANLRIRHMSWVAVKAYQRRLGIRQMSVNR